MKKQNIDHTQMLLLTLLKEGDMYGYQMITELSRRSNNVFNMKEGTLYPVLHLMQKNGLVSAYEQKAPTGRLRKYYKITKKGLQNLQEEKETWAEYSSAVDAVLNFA